MKRFHLFEVGDQAWCPRSIRDAITDYLEFVASKTTPYAPIVPILASALRSSGQTRIVDLCSGAAGPWPWLRPVLAKMGLEVSVCLTDKYPNLGASGKLNGNLEQVIRYHPAPVDATRVPEELTGFRTMFTAFHHFEPAQARALLADAVRQRQGIAIFEGTERGALALLLMLCVVPLMVLVVTPFIRPFRWSRLLWTYVLPLAPLITVFDGLVSCLRTYQPAELRELTAGIGASDYRWEVGLASKPHAPIPVTYLVGVPLRPTV